MSSPATTALPLCGICRPLPFSYFATATFTDVDVESLTEAEDPQSLVVEVDSDRFVDVAVSTHQQPDRSRSSSQSSDWLSDRLIEDKQTTTSAEPEWTEISKFKFSLTTDSQPAE